MAKGDGNNGGGNKATPGIALTVPVGLTDIHDPDTMARATTVAAGLACLIPVVFYGFKAVSKGIFRVKPGDIPTQKSLAGDIPAIRQAIQDLAKTNPGACKGIAAEMRRGLQPEDATACASILGGNN